MKAFVTSQFGYGRPLVWIFHSGGLNNKIYSLNEGLLKIT